jgi:hypothetical protein
MQINFLIWTFIPPQGPLDHACCSASDVVRQKRSSGPCGEPTIVFNTALANQAYKIVAWLL